MPETDQNPGCGFTALSSLFHPCKPRNLVLLQEPTPKNNQFSKVKPRPTYARKSTSHLDINQQTKVSSEGTTPRRASTGNVILLGHTNQKSKALKTELDQKNPCKLNSPKIPNHQLGNILYRPTHSDAAKSLGNEKYKQGKYEEALTLYDRAISIDPNRACYYGNKAAALIALGRLVEAVFQCREAVRIDSSYHNAHFRLAKLYMRLGVAEKAVYHYKSSGQKASSEDIVRAEDLKHCIERCVEARSNGDWKKLLDESQIASSLGADSALQIHAAKAEALMRLHRHQEAYTVMQNAPRFHAEFLGSAAASVILQVRAMVYMANGRFEDAVRDSRQSVNLDSSDSVKLAAERVQSVASARASGNRLFKGSRYSEGLIAYNVGLEIDPRNSVLLCNRAACRFKLGQYEKAVEDCSAALLVRDCYSKARLRRANCYAQMEKWEAAVEDYGILMRENPRDEEVKGALFEATRHLNEARNGNGNGEVISADVDTISNLSSVSSDEDFTYFTTTPGLSVVLFCSERRSRKTLKLLGDVCVKFPSVNFVKVDVEERLSIAKSERVKLIPTFRIYRNGSRVEEIEDSFDKLERCITSYCSSSFA